MIGFIRNWFFELKRTKFGRYNMIRLSTKGRYGTRVMVALAKRYGYGMVLLKEIAREEDISEGYLEHILPLLKSAGLVRSNRGAHGGYVLSKPPSEITLKDIIETTEGSLTPVECVDSPAVCHRADFCVTRDVWQDLKDSIAQTLDSINLQELVKKQEDKIKIFSDFTI